MATTLGIVTSSAPIDIQPSHSLPASPTLSTNSSSSCVNSPTLGESPGDSGYESSWPSLSEAAAWSPPPGQKRQLNLLKSNGSNGSIDSPEHSPFNTYNKDIVVPLLLTPQHSNRQQNQQHHNNRKHSTDNTTKITQKGQQQALTQQKSTHGSKGQKRRMRNIAYQAKKAAQPRDMTPLVDFGSPQMEDDDQYYGQVDPPIPLSVIPRGWLFEEEFAPSIVDDILIAVPNREWTYDSSSPMSMDTKSFAVMSWNLLSPRLCHASRLDAACDPTFLDWNYRKEAILNQIAFTDADIICLQELELKDYEEYFNPHLSRLGFRSIHAYKMNVYEMRDGCAIFYRDSRFKLLNEHTLRFNQVELDDYNVKRPSMARDTAIRFNLFHNLAIVALFENRRTKHKVQIATTHLLADPAFPDAKMLQTAILTSKLEELAAEAVAAVMVTSATVGTSQSQNQTQAHQQQQHIPTILAGDFNSLPDSPVVSFLKTGQIETCHFGENDFGRFTRANSKHFYHNLGLADSYKSSILPFTNATRKFQGTIDYLLYDPSSLGLVGFLDHLEPEPSSLSSSSSSSSSSWNTLPKPALSSAASSKSISTRTETSMSLSDIDSELDVDVPSSLTSSSSLSSSLSATSINSVDRAKKAHKNNTKKVQQQQQHLDFSKLFSSKSSEESSLISPTSSVTPKLSDKIEKDQSGPTVSRAPLPTALPSLHFPSDHIPLVAIFREREYIPASVNC
ncbi:Glucose-repressible alcohol dehydrogenase transcriptional effector [Haplosporangium sp. Z 27]|nr:Glucose-repressible alcohol dehydrogenase transcriptional effector [Haplosporangium sp. Z 27]